MCEEAQARPHAEVLAELMDPCTRPFKSEHEWAGRREIRELRDRAKELEDRKTLTRDLVRFVLERRELDQCWFVDADGDTGDCAYGDHCNPHCPLYKLAELVR